jgi:hypothetical protein
VRYRVLEGELNIDGNLLELAIYKKNQEAERKR